MNVINKEGFGVGVCSADINQDGQVDFLLTVYGNDILYINQKGESFKQIQMDNEKNHTNGQPIALLRIWIMMVIWTFMCGGIHYLRWTVINLAKQGKDLIEVIITLVITQE